MNTTCSSSWYCRPDYVGGSTILDNWKEAPGPRCIAGARCTVQFLNKGAFGQVPLDAKTRIAIRPGNLGNGALRSPATWSMDASIARNFQLSERYNVQFRADMFNSTNHVSYNGPNAGFNNATFGEISGAGGMRVIQLNAKLSF
jgi:hypothetical protein